MLEELLDSMELFHFIMRIVGEDLSYVELFQDSLGKVLRKRVKRLVDSYSESMRPKSEQEFFKRPEYIQLLEETKTQFRGIIDSIRTNRLLYVQGGGPPARDIPANLSKLIEKTEISIQDVQFLRSIPLDRISFTPELSAYHKAAFKCCLSNDGFIRAFSYSQYLEAPVLIDSNQYFDVMKYVTEIWTKQEVTIEFAGALHTLLVSLNDVINGILDDDIQHAIYKFIEDILVSHNLSLLYVFDPLLKWLPKPFPEENTSRALSKSIFLLKEGSHAHACIILSAIERGATPIENLIDTVRASKPTIAEWSQAIQVEARKYLRALGSKIKEELMNQVLAEFKEICEIPSAIFVFSDFICSHYMNRNSPIYEPLFLSIEKGMLSPSASLELKRMYISICNSPIRLIQALKISKNRELFAKILDFPRMSCTLLSVIYDKSYILVSSSNASERIKKIKELCEVDFETVDVHINAMICSLLYPQVLKEAFKSFFSLSSEEQRTVYASLICGVFACDFTPVPELIGVFPEQSYKTEYSVFTDLAKNLKAEDRCTKLRNALQLNVKVGSKELINLALLFEYVVAKEDQETRIAFERARLRPAEWFSAVGHSLLSSLFKEITKLINRYSESKDDLLVIVWVAYYAVKRLSSKWLDLIDEENFTELAPAFFFPLSVTLGDDEREESKALSEKYQSIYPDIQALTK